MLGNRPVELASIAWLGVGMGVGEEGVGGLWRLGKWVLGWTLGKGRGSLV